MLVFNTISAIKAVPGGSDELIATEPKLIAGSTGFAVYACQHIPSTQSEVLGR